VLLVASSKRWGSSRRARCEIRRAPRAASGHSAQVSARGVGLYAVAVALSEALWFIANSVATVLLPKLSAAEAEDAARTTPIVCRNTILLTAVAAILLATLSLPLVPQIEERVPRKFSGDAVERRIDIHFDVSRDPVRLQMIGAGLHVSTAGYAPGRTW